MFSKADPVLVLNVLGMEKYWQAYNYFFDLLLPHSRHKHVIYNEHVASECIIVGGVGENMKTSSLCSSSVNPQNMH
jgi:hypothetical protein